MYALCEAVAAQLSLFMTSAPGQLGKGRGGSYQPQQQLSGKMTGICKISVISINLHS